MAACSTKGARDTPAAQPRPLEIRIGDRTVPITRAFAARLPASRVRLVVSTTAADGCGYVQAYRSSTGLPGAFVFELAPRLARDGTLAYTVDAIAGIGAHQIEPGATARIDGHLALGLVADIAIDVRAVGREAGTMDAGVIPAGPPVSARGTIAALSCGDSELERLEFPATIYPSNAKLTIAGHELPLASAVVPLGPLVAEAGGGAGGEVVLSTGPQTCRGFPFIDPPEVALRQRADSWTLEGVWFGTDKPQGPAPTLRVQRGARGTGPSGGVIDLELSGTATIGGYTVALAGRMEALEFCPNGPPPRER